MRSTSAGTITILRLGILDGKDVRDLPLEERKALLMRVVHRASNSQLRLSETFDDGGSCSQPPRRWDLRSSSQSGATRST